MTPKTETAQAKGPLEESKHTLGLAGKPFKPGSNMSFGLVNSRVTVALDHLGDWTIMIGLSTRADHLVSKMFSLEQMGFFKATEADGSIYFLWTSALANDRGTRSVVESILFETLRTLQVNAISPYIS